MPNINEIVSKIEDESLREQIMSAVKGSTDNLASQIEKLKNKNYELVGKLKSVKSSIPNIPEDFDPELWKSLKEEHKKRQTEKLKAEERWEELTKQLQSEHQKELEKLNEKANKYKTSLESYMIDSAAIKAISEEKGIVDLLIPHVKSKLKVIEEDGKFNVVVVDDNGDVRYNTKNSGKPFTVKDLVNEMKAKDSFAVAFNDPTISPGARGSRGTSSHVKNPFKKGTDSYNLTEQARLRRENPSLAAQLAKAAGVNL